MRDRLRSANKPGVASGLGSPKWMARVLIIWTRFFCTANPLSHMLFMKVQVWHYVSRLSRKFLWEIHAVTFVKFARKFMTRNC